MSLTNKSVSSVHNSFCGDEAGYNNTSGNENTGIGAYSNHSNQTGHRNTCIGNYAGYTNLDNENTFVGYKAGLANTTGTPNLFIGAFADAGSGNLVNASAIGPNAMVMSGNSMILGDTDVNVGIGLSGILPGPQDKLEVNSGNSCVSGLTFRQLNSSCTPATLNPGAGVLAVDQSGKVIYVPDNGGGTLQTADNGLSVDASMTNVQLGNPIGNTTAQLLQDSEIPMNNFNLVFSEPSPGSNSGSSNSVGIGTILPLARLHVYKPVSAFSALSVPVAALFENNDLGSGIFGSSIGLSVLTTNTNFTNYGLKSEARDAGYNYAGYFQTINNATANTGAYFESSGSTRNYAVHAYAPAGNLSPANFAVYADAPTFNPQAGFNVAVYGSAPVNGGLLPPAGTGSWAGYFNGDLAHTGAIGVPSDSTLKTNIQSLTDAGSILTALNTYSYYYDTAQFGSYINFPKTIQFGLLAQEVEAIAPNLVINSALPPKMDSLGNIMIPVAPVKNINYMGFIPLLIQGNNEQQSVIDSLIS